jgi:hypothetical protein
MIKSAKLRAVMFVVGIALVLLAGNPGGTSLDYLELSVGFPLTLIAYVEAEAASRGDRDDES